MAILPRERLQISTHRVSFRDVADAGIAVIRAATNASDRTDPRPIRRHRKASLSLLIVDQDPQSGAVHIVELAGP